MPRFYVKTQVNFVRTIEADSYEDAMDKGYYYDPDTYESVEDVQVEELYEDDAEYDDIEDEEE